METKAHKKEVTANSQTTKESYGKSKDIPRSEGHQENPTSTKASQRQSKDIKARMRNQKNIARESKTVNVINENQRKSLTHQGNRNHLKHINKTQSNTPGSLKNFTGNQRESMLNIRYSPKQSNVHGTHMKPWEIKGHRR